ncbi:MAG: ATP-dependent DNA helicase RecG [Patescibacteria group bacterium]|nr:ATP-dependent DNA helicase RecG [Patescibacteria group bacterium]
MVKLSDKIIENFRVNETQKKALEKLGLFSLKDLLFYFPSRYTDISSVKYIKDIKDREKVTLLGEISNLKTKKGFQSKIPMGNAKLTDTTGSINIVWFHQPYLAKMLKENSTVRVTGKVSNHETYGLTLTNPEIGKGDILPIDLFNDNQEQQFGYPVYSESKGITSKWIYHAIQKILKNNIKIDEYLPEEILKKYSLPTIKTALIWIHLPQKKEHAKIARKRFAFEEVFLIQLSRQKEREKYESLFSYKLNPVDIKNFIKRFPFKPTNSQNKAIKNVLGDLVKDKPMSRLIEGDVGSGKTFVAATVSYVVIQNRPKGQNFGNLQVAYMAPTEVLATQLFENFIEYFKHTGIQIGLLTGKSCRKYPSKVEDGWTNISKNQLLKWVKNGEIPILIGTHSLISKSVDFEDLGLVIIDEQHRFGTNQRMKLAKKEGHVPHYLSMTATPIPRTLALTIYGDLDLSIIDEMPPGRKKVITKIIEEKKRNTVYPKIKSKLDEGRQLYVICPKIEEPDEDNKLNLKSVKAEAKTLKEEIFPEFNIDIMHSKMTKQKKEKVMEDFKNKEIDILVSTSVIEVGVNVPNATMIIIEGADRFGLAQLHQLRGRVIRSTYQSYCYLFSESKNEKTIDRLKALSSSSNGFKLAELDLKLRGAGLLSGEKQWGITDLGMEAIRNIKMVEAAREEATKLVSEINKHPLILDKIEEINLHFE